MTPYQYLKELKELMIIEKEKLMIQKEASVKSKDFETAALYRDIESKILDFINNLNLKQ